MMEGLEKRESTGGEFQGEEMARALAPKTTRPWLAGKHVSAAGMQ